jgi:thymidylate synthase
VFSKNKKHIRIMNKLDLDYQNLLKDILENGVTKNTRNGITRSVFGRQIRHDMKSGFPLLTTKRMYWRGIVTELLWFLQGRTDLRYLLENDCQIWTGDAYKSYTNKFVGYEDIPSKEWFINEIKTNDEFAKKFGNLGKIYGYQWRNWNGEIDQISELIKELKSNPDSRRILLSAWNPSDLPHQVLPPCHYGFQVYTRELSESERFNWYGQPHHDHIEQEMDQNNVPKRAISLMWNQRSVDIPLGLPFNIASYGLLLEIIAKEVNMVPDELIGNLGDCHVYENQQDGVKEQLKRDSFKLPVLNIIGTEPSIIEKPSYWKPEDFQIENYQSHPAIKMPLSN